MDNETFWTSAAMITYGGSFVKHLGSMIPLADDNNLQRIKNAWPEYWERYKVLGQELKAKKGAYAQGL